MKNKSITSDFTENKLSPYSRESRVALAGMVTRLFEHWELPLEDQLAFLGLSNRTTLTRYRKGAPLANHRDLLDRVASLFEIHHLLRILYPHNREIVYEWMTTPNRDFNGRAPGDIVREQGFPGLLSVKRYLEHERER